MKRFFALLLVLVFASSFAFADGIDLSALSFQQLAELQRQITAEIITRPEWKEVTVPGGTWIVGTDIPAGTYSISAGKGGGYLSVRTASGSLVISQGIRDAANAIGKIELKNGYTVAIERGSLIFSPFVSLSF